MRDFREELLNVKSDIIKEINSIREKHPNITFFTLEDYEDSNIDVYLDVRNDMGGTDEVFLLNLTPDGYLVADVSEGTAKRVSVLDFASTHDLIEVYELLITNT